MKCKHCDKTPEVDKYFKKTLLLCNAHYLQIKRHGKILKNHRRSPHKIIWHDDYFEMSLSNNKGEIVGWTKVDKEDYKKVIQHKWHLRDGYVVTKNDICESLHRYVLITEMDAIDHISRDRLDNRKSNLRGVDWHINGFNKSMLSNNTSGHVGVHWDKSRNKWTAQIGYMNKNIHLGRYDDIEDAIKARKEAEKKYYKGVKI